MLTVDDLKAGQHAQILTIDDADVALQAIRLGICEGETIVCVAKVPSGPTVVQRGGMELAIGRDLCRKIKVSLS